MNDMSNVGELWRSEYFVRVPVIDYILKLADHLNILNFDFTNNHK